MTAPRRSHWWTLSARVSVALLGLFVLAFAALGVLSQSLGEGEDVSTWVDEMGKQRLRSYRSLALAQRARETTDSSLRARQLSALRSLLVEQRVELGRLSEGATRRELLQGWAEQRVARLESTWAVLGEDLLEHGQGSPQLTSLIEQEVDDYVEAVSRVNRGYRALYHAETRQERRRGLFALLTTLAAAVVMVLAASPVLSRREARAEELTDEVVAIRAILDASAISVVSIDAAGVIRWFNAAGERLFGYTSEEVLGENVSMLMPEPFAREHDDYLARFLQTGVARILNREREVFARLRSGEVIPVGLRVIQTRLAGAKAFVAYLEDRRGRNAVQETVSRTAARIVSTNQEVSDSARRTLHEAQQQASAVTETVAAANQVSRSSEENAACARQVAESSRGALEAGKAGREALVSAIASMDRVEDRSEAVGQAIIRLAERVQDIGQIVDTVAALADQTNLLALNAAIEASHAGDQGHGFRVIAGEVRTLAERSKGAAAHVRRVITEVQQVTNDAVLSMEAGTRVVREGRGAVESANRAFDTLQQAIDRAAHLGRRIEASTSQQATGAWQILEAMRHVDSVSAEHVSAAQSVEEALASLGTLATELRSSLSAWGR